MFREDRDYLVARDGKHMKELLALVLNDDTVRADLKLNGLERILSRHTCAHRVRQLLGLYDEIAPAGAALTETASL